MRSSPPARSPQESHLLTQYLVLCIFTWCRVYMVLLRSLNFATGAMYSLSITLAGFTTGAFVLGPLCIIEFIAFLSLAAALWRWSADCSLYGVCYEELTREHVRAELLDTSAMSAWKGIASDASVEESLEAARKAFDRIDKDKSGSLDAGEVQRLLGSLKVHPTVRHAISAKLAANDGSIDFSTFVRSVWNLGAKAPGEDLSTEQLEAMATSEEQARAVFDSIDLDGSGQLEAFEIAELLIQWGCPEHEVGEYIRRTDVDGDGTISFQEFLTKMATIWRFGHQVLKDRAVDRLRKGWSLYDAATPRATSRGTPRISASKAASKDD